MTNDVGSIAAQFYADMLNSEEFWSGYRGKLDDTLGSVLHDLFKIYSDEGKILFWDEMRVGYEMPAPNPLDIHITWTPEPVPPVFDMPHVDRNDFVLGKVQLDSCFKSRDFS